MGLVGLVEFDDHFNDSRDSNDPKELDDPPLFDDQLEVLTLIIQMSTVIPPSRNDGLVFTLKTFTMHRCCTDVLSVVALV